MGLALKYLILLGLESEDLSAPALSVTVKGGVGVVAFSLPTADAFGAAGFGQAPVVISEILLL